MMNTPNTLAFIRILVSPVIFWILLNRDNAALGIHPSWMDFFAGFLFVLAGLTDFFDGFIARTWDERTKLGSIIDPLADKMLTLAAFLGLMSQGVASPWAIFLILTREFFITGLRVVAVSEGKEISASFIGKLKTTVQLIAIGFLIMHWPFASLLLWAAVAITIYSGYEYTKEYIKL
ncbi:MAG: CDP-diacylglycerol--glycerol-3-phosphate 3-phosphatidyltransferase [Campylobacteraceae bacterium]|jgi:CDP-diacylglycerol--glycerol-3-phosphate 3-phosphatidyltransferase|nr:CDP-diacylglycerol--glycerol-3-phosphate 3-phosphatidyltransferase [Campylobacteraceae bacterium]